ncbi:uncharacterized protein LOC111518610 [Drosophila willistoni]|uniref:uncharacterized protein LOC111518610 n=1 Tax=Drosophila willistoni TaxID=7260 RepID=UPI001F084062|nr:uncharacterized protein LOC111518610 [Drosophila willistoni]
MENQPQINILTDLKDILSDLSNIFQSEPKGLATKRLANDLVNGVLSNLVTVTEEDEITSPILLKKIIKALVDTGIKSESLTTEQRQLVSKVFECIRFEMGKCSGAEAASLLDQLWTNQFQFIAQMLVQFFDVYNSYLGTEQCQLLLLVIKQQIQSKEQEQRKMGYHLMKELDKIFNSNQVVSNELKCTPCMWSTYIHILEHLENQTFDFDLCNWLIVFKDADNFSAWLHILFIKLLQSDDTFVGYITITFIANELKFSQLTDWNVIDEFLVATNRTELYNIDDNFRKDPFFTNFVSKSENMDTFMEIFVSVSWDWNFIPLFEWLSSVLTEKSHLVGKDVMLKIISHVEKSKISLNMRHHLEILLQTFWDPFTLEDVLVCIQEMYKNRKLYYLPYCKLKQKVLNCEKFQLLLSSFNKSFDVVFKTWTPESFVIAVLDKIKDVDKTKLGWIRFYIMSKYNYNEKIRDFYSSVYDVDSSLILKGKDLDALKQHLFDKLMCQTSEEKSLVTAMAIDLYVENQLDEWSLIEEMELKPLELLNLGGHQTLKHMTELLSKSLHQLKDDRILSTILDMLQKYPCYDTCKAIGQYAVKHMTIEEQCKISAKLLDQNEDNIGILESGIKLSSSTVIQGILYYGPLTGDEWTEMTYTKAFTRDSSLPVLYVNYLQKQSNDFRYKVVHELLRINMTLSESNPQYGVNSMEHRLKFRIASALMFLQNTKYQCITQIRNALQTEYEQFNIRCFYEMVMARTLPTMDAIHSELKLMYTYSINMQISILSVAHIALLAKQWHLRQFEKIQRIFEVFLSLTMENDFEIRQFAKFIIHNLIEKCDKDRFNLPIAKTLRTCIKENTAGKLVDAKIRARLLLPKLYRILSQEYKTFSYYDYTFNMSNIKMFYDMHHSDVILGVREAFKAVSNEALKAITPTN